MTQTAESVPMFRVLQIIPLSLAQWVIFRDKRDPRMLGDIVKPILALALVEEWRRPAGGSDLEEPIDGDFHIHRAIRAVYQQAGDTEFAVLTEWDDSENCMQFPFITDDPAIVSGGR